MRFLFITLFLVTISRAAQVPFTSVEGMQNNIDLLFKGTNFEHPDENIRDQFFGSMMMSKLIQEKITNPNAECAYLGQTYENAHCFSYYVAEKIKNKCDYLSVATDLACTIPMMEQVVTVHSDFINGFLKKADLPTIDMPNGISIDVSWGNILLDNDFKSLLIVAAQKNNRLLFTDLLEKGADAYLYINELFLSHSYDCLNVLKERNYKIYDNQILFSLIDRMKTSIKSDDDKILGLLLSMESDNLVYNFGDISSLFLKVLGIIKITKNNLTSHENDFRLYEKALSQESYSHCLKDYEILAKCLNLLGVKLIKILKDARLVKKRGQKI